MQAFAEKCISRLRTDEQIVYVYRSRTSMDQPDCNKNAFYARNASNVELPQLKLSVQFEKQILFFW